MKTKVIRQKDLSAECWLVQFSGTDYCNFCEYKDTKDCGGKNILKTGKNENGKVIGKNGLGEVTC